MLTIRQIAERLSSNAEAVCAHYLSNGRRHGRYWLVGDVHNAAGRSLFVRLTGPTYGPGAAGKWTDTANPDHHGDMLDLIMLTCGLNTLQQARDEALRFLSEPAHIVYRPQDIVVRDSTPSARRLFKASRPLLGTLGEAYLRSARGITCSLDEPALRFHPRCFYVAGKGTTRLELPAIIAAITDLAGTITGVKRIYLNDDGSGKAAITAPRRALGNVLGHAFRIGKATDVLAAGEGLETMLSIRSLLPAMPIAAATSANHLAALLLPATLHRLYIAHDHGLAGLAAAEQLALRAVEIGIDVRMLTPPGEDDWNSDFTGTPLPALRGVMSRQLHPMDAEAYLQTAAMPLCAAL